MFNRLGEQVPPVEWPGSDEGYWFPSSDVVVTIHYLVPRRPSKHDRDDRGVREPGAIEGAIARARGQWFERGGTLEERAAMLLRGICQDHAFVNANKRTAYLVALTFLRNNGRSVRASEKTVVRFMLRVAQPGCTVVEITDWLTARAFGLQRSTWGDILQFAKSRRRSYFSWRWRRDLFATVNALTSLRGQGDKV